MEQIECLLQNNAFNGIHVYKNFLYGPGQVKLGQVKSCQFGRGQVKLDQVKSSQERKKKVEIGEVK